MTVWMNSPVEAYSPSEALQSSACQLRCTSELTDNTALHDQEEDEEEDGNRRQMLL